MLNPKPLKAACYTRGDCTNCKYGDNGCSWSPFSGSYACNCNGATLYCDRGTCGTCTPPACPSHYTTTNTGCSTTTTSCNRTDCVGSCGTTYRTCYKVIYTVTYDGNSGSCTPSNRSVCYNSTSAAPSCSRSGYILTGFTRTSGSGGTLNTSTGEVTNVSGNQTIQAQWTLANQGPSSPSNLLTEAQTNPTDVTNITPDFSAQYNDPDSGDTATHYRIQVNTQSNFAGTSLWDSGKLSLTTNVTEGNQSEDITYNGTTLTYNGQTYYWRIKFWDDSDAEGSWSSAANFTMDIPTAEYYQIQVNTQSDFGGTSMWDSGKTSMTSTTAGQRSPTFTYSGSTLQQGVTYYWRIKFWDMNDNDSAWSSYATFKLDQTPTAPTDLQTESSTNPPKVTDSTPEFSAIFDDPDTSNQANYYEVEVNTQENFEGAVMWDSGKTSMTATNENSRSPEISYAGSALSDGTTYYWRIKFWDVPGLESPWSSVGNFTMSGSPTASSLLTSGQTNPEEVLDPYFSAIYTDPNEDNSSAYEIEVNTAETFDGTSMWDTGKTSATITSEERSSDISYDGTELSYDGTTYYVRMRFWDIDDNVSNWVTGEFVDAKRFYLDGLRMNGIRLD